MLSQDEVFQYLVGLPDADYADVVFRAESTRHERVADAFEAVVPPASDRDAVAYWLARQHLAVDPGITEVFYLRAAPANEIRFIEVNRLLPILEPLDGQFEFVDFALDNDQLAYSLSVIDMTSDQWQKIIDGALRLPEGWTANPHSLFRREA